MEAISVSAIWQKSCLGDPQAQSELYRRFAGKMYSLCLRYIADRDEASDVLQNGFIKVFSKADSYSGEGSLEGWIRKIMVNTAIEQLRSNRKRWISTEELDSCNQENLRSDMLEQSDFNDLMDLIRLLPEDYRTVFNLYAIEGYNHQEIASMLAISEGNSKSRLSRARSWLRKRLKMMEEFEQCKKTI